MTKPEYYVTIREHQQNSRRLSLCFHFEFPNATDNHIWEMYLLEDLYSTLNMKNTKKKQNKMKRNQRAFT